MATTTKTETKKPTMMYSISGGVGNQADKYNKLTKTLGEQVGQLHGHEMKVPVLQLKETKLMEPVLTGANPTRVKELKWGKDYDLYLKN